MISGKKLLSTIDLNTLTPEELNNHLNEEENKQLLLQDVSLLNKIVDWAINLPHQGIISKLVDFAQNEENDIRLLWKVALQENVAFSNLLNNNQVIPEIDLMRAFKVATLFKKQSNYASLLPKLSYGALCQTAPFVVQNSAEFFKEILNYHFLKDDVNFLTFILAYAGQINNTEVIRICLNQSALLNNLAPTLIEFISKNKPTVINNLLKHKAFANAANTALMTAYKRGKHDIVMQLLGYEEIMNNADPDLLSGVFIYAYDPVLINQLLKFPLKQDAITTKLIYSAQAGKLAIVKTILKLNDIELYDWSVKSNYPMISYTLLETNSAVWDHAGYEKKQIVLSGLRNKFYLPLDLLNTAMHLLDLNQRDLRGKTLLHYATMNADIPLIKILVKLGAKHLPDDESISPFFIAMMTNQTDILSLFLDTMADDEMLLSDHQERTVLFGAVMKNDLAMVNMLLKKKGIKDNVNHRDLYGKTALDYAISNKNDEIIKVLSDRPLDEIKKSSAYGIPLFDNMHQEVLNNNLIQYLKTIFFDAKGKIIHRIGTEIVESNGNCQGWSDLRKIVSEEEAEEIRSFLSKVDITDLQKAQNLFQQTKILKHKYKGDGKQLSVQVFLENLIHQLSFFQFTAKTTKELNTNWGQYSFPELYQFLKDTTLNKEVKQLFSFKEKPNESAINKVEVNRLQLIELLKFLSRWPGTKTSLFLVKHTTNLTITEDGKFKYYDANHRNYVPDFDSAEQLADHIIKFHYKFNHFMKNDKIALSYDVFRIDHKDKLLDLEKPIPLAPISPSPNGFSELHYAVMENDIHKVKAIVKNDPGLISKKDAHGYTPLIRAISCNTKGIVKELIEIKEFRAQFTDCDRVAHWALNNDFTEIFTLLFKDQIKEIKKFNPPSPLQNWINYLDSYIFPAVMSGSFECLQVVFQENDLQKVSFPNTNVYLNLAIMNNRPEMFSFMLAREDFKKNVDLRILEVALAHNNAYFLNELLKDPNIQKLCTEPLVKKAIEVHKSNPYFFEALLQVQSFRSHTKMHILFSWALQQGYRQLAKTMLNYDQLKKDIKLAPDKFFTMAYDHDAGEILALLLKMEDMKQSADNFVTDKLLEEAKQQGKTMSTKVLETYLAEKNEPNASPKVKKRM